MAEMFMEATSFNQNIGRWNVSNVTDMSSMFNDATSFNEDISRWNVSNVYVDYWSSFFERCPIRNEFMPQRLRPATVVTGGRVTRRYKKRKSATKKASSRRRERGLKSKRRSRK